MEDYILTHGSYLAVILIIALTGAGLPLPEEVPIVAAGVLSSPSVARLNPFLAFGACLIGALLGDAIMYAIGRFLGKTFLRRYPLFARILHEDREKQMEELIRTQGLKVFLLARFLVGVRAPVYMAAGVLRVRFAKFLLVDALCATIVVGTVFWLSWLFGESVAPLVRESQWAVTIIVLVGLLFAFAYWMLWRKYYRKLQLHQSDPSSEGDPAGRDDKLLQTTSDDHH